jgi:polyhydroxyalkanoate synthesis regulator phasin
MRLFIPTDRDMDELYKEIYELKKRVKDMEKEKVMH